MKKSLLAFAAMGAFAGAAQAQSSVTVYGLIDYGFQGGNQYMSGPGAATASAGTPSQGNVVTRQYSSGFAANGESTSRLGFRGTEDLGGGTRAFFTVEMALSPDSSTSISSTNATSNRQSFVGLAQKGLGAVSMGMQYTPIHEAAAVTDAGGLNNQNGNVIYDRAGGYGSQQIIAGTGNIGNAGSGMATNTSYTVRTSNSFIFKSENMSGLVAKAMIVAGGKDSNITAGNTTSTSTSAYGGSLDYTWKKLFVTAAYQQFYSDGNPAGANVSSTFTAGYAGAVSTPGVNARDSQQYYAATYDFGILKAYAQYVSRKISFINNANVYVQRSAQQLGVRAPITKTVTAWASAGTGSINPTGSGGNKANFNGWQLGTDYNLSKRTNLYAIYGQTSTSSIITGLYSANGAAAATNAAIRTGTTGYSASSYAVGVRHTF